jgi:hypothetical protein
MSSQAQFPTRLASEDVIINAPFSYAGSAQRIWRIRRRARVGWPLVAVTMLAIVFVVVAWAFVTAWYLIWGLWLVPYRLLRRGARKRKAQAMRHRELMGAIQGSAAASSAAIVTGMTATLAPAPAAAPPPQSPTERVSDTDRDAVMEELRRHMAAGRLTTQELEERLALADSAVTRGDLEGITVDLPMWPRGEAPQ